MSVKLKNKVWCEVKDDLIKRILAKEFKINSKFYSLKGLSSEYGISDITSRRVIAELAKEGYIESFPGKGSFVKSCLAEKKIVLLTEQTPEIISSDILPNLVSEIYKGMLLECAGRNADLQVLSKKYLKQWPLGKSLSVILLGDVIIDDKNLANVLKRPNCHKVFCHNTEETKGEKSVRIDYRAGMAMATKHLISRGHQRIAFLCSPMKRRGMALRFDAYYTTLRKLNIPFDLTLVKELPSPDIKSDSEAIKSLMKLKKPPTAIITANNSRGLNVLEYCLDAGIKIPKQLALVAFDNIPESVLVSPKLTVINTFWSKIGMESVKALLKMVETGESNYEDIIIKPELVIREST